MLRGNEHRELFWLFKKDADLLHRVEEQSDGGCQFWQTLQIQTEDKRSECESRLR